MKAYQLFSFTAINNEQAKVRRPKTLRITSIIKGPVCIFAPVFTFLLLTSFFIAGSALAENITYNNNTTLLQPDPVDSTHSSLYPTAGISLTDNIITLDSGTIPGSIYGGVSVAGNDVTGNVITINGGTVNYNVYGGYSGISLNIIGSSTTNEIKANNNRIVLNGGSVSGNFYGGYAGLNLQGTNVICAYVDTIATANDNTIILGDNITILGVLYGGYAALNIQRGTTSLNGISAYARDSDANANNNSITLGAGVIVASDLYGGYAAYYIQSGTVSGAASAYAYARAATSTATANANSVTLNGSNVSNNLYGGYAELNIQGGTATATSSDTSSYAVIDVNTSANANDNRVILNGGNVYSNLYGGYAEFNIQGGIADATTANTYAYAEASTANANGNRVILNGGSVSSNLYGGYTALNLQGGIATATNGTNAAAQAEASTANANDNRVFFNSGSVSGNLYGGYAAFNLYGGDAVTTTPANPYAAAYVFARNSTISANNNIVSLNSGSVSGNLYGGYAALNLQGGTATAASGSDENIYCNYNSISANKNSVLFNGALGNDNIYGGYILLDMTTTGNVNIFALFLTATDNIVTIGENAVFNAANSLYGGCLKYNGVYNSNIIIDVFTGNTLNISGKHTIDGIYNFENLSFTLPVGFASSDTLITATGNVNLDEYNTGSGSTVTEINSTGILTVGNTYTLISATGSFNGTIANINNEADGVYNTGFVSGTYEWVDVDIYGNILTATLKNKSGGSLNPETSAIGEGFAAGLAFLGQAADLRTGLYFAPQNLRFIPFAKMVYGSQYISTGSSVKVKGFSTIAGLALNTNFDDGNQLVVGAFIEGGWGDYNSRNSFAKTAVVNGKGDTKYYGGGILARYATAEGLYGEGAFAAGKTETDFKSLDFVPGTTTKYDYSVPYYSAHLALGQVLNLTDMLNLNIYGKYLWTRQMGDNVTVDGSRFKFKDADSHRVRVGGKLEADVSAQFIPYIGAAYEYEFSGKTKGNLYGMNLDEPSLRGSTGIGELGLVWTPTDAQNLKVDLGMQGYAGKREGLSGGLTVSLSF